MQRDPNLLDLKLFHFQCSDQIFKNFDILNSTTTTTTTTKKQQHNNNNNDDDDDDDNNNNNNNNNNNKLESLNYIHSL